MLPATSPRTAAGTGLAARDASSELDVSIIGCQLPLQLACPLAAHDLLKVVAFEHPYAQHPHGSGDQDARAREQGDDLRRPILARVVVHIAQFRDTHADRDQGRAQCENRPTLAAVLPSTLSNVSDGRRIAATWVGARAFGPGAASDGLPVPHASFGRREQHESGLAAEVPRFARRNARSAATRRGDH